MFNLDIPFFNNWSEYQVATGVVIVIVLIIALIIAHLMDTFILEIILIFTALFVFLLLNNIGVTKERENAESDVITVLEHTYEDELVSVKKDTRTEGSSSKTYFVVELEDGAVLEFTREANGNEPVFSSERRSSSD